MKINTKRLKEIIKEELLTERLKRFKVYVSGESQPLILMGKNEKEVKQTAHQMIRNSSIKIRKVVKEGKLNERMYTQLEALETAIFDIIIEFKKAFEKSPHKKNRKVNMLIKQMLKLEGQLGDIVTELE
tara:strand:- start:155 stop:541 length:387 start_codon:yes stop_codon:yes gene_type:complete